MSWESIVLAIWQQRGKRHTICTQLAPSCALQQLKLHCFLCFCDDIHPRAGGSVAHFVTIAQNKTVTLIQHFLPKESDFAVAASHERGKQPPASKRMTPNPDALAAMHNLGSRPAAMLFLA